MSDASPRIPDGAPRMLRERAEPEPLPVPLADSEELSALHVSWAILHARAAASSEGGEPGGQEPGAQEPGAQEPGAQEPGAQEPGAQEPTGEESGERGPGGPDGDPEEPAHASAGHPLGGRARAKARARFVTAVRPIAAEEAERVTGRVDSRVAAVEPRVDALERESAHARSTAEARTGEDRGLIGSLIRAVDALAARVDEIAARVGALEHLVQDVVDMTSEDLARVLARGSSQGTDDQA